MTQKFTLVTGAAGFIGSRLTQKLIDQGRNVIALDCFLPDSYDSQVKIKRWKLLNDQALGQLVKIEFDLRKDDFAQLDKFSIDSIFNQAAMPGLQTNWGKFSAYYDCNISALNRLLEYSRNLSLNSFVQASTSSVYGRSAVGDESQDLRPTSPYGVSKLAAEKLLLAYLDWFAVPAKILRYFSVYGPHQRPDMAYSRIIECIIHKRVFTIFGDGEQKRSNTFIDDVVDATLLAETKAKPGDIMNICGDDTVSLNEAILIIEATIGNKLSRMHTDSRIGDQRDTSGSNVFAKNRLGWQSKTGILEGLTSQVKAALS